MPHTIRAGEDGALVRTIGAALVEALTAAKLAPLLLLLVVAGAFFVHPPYRAWTHLPPLSNVSGASDLPDSTRRHHAARGGLLPLGADRHLPLARGALGRLDAAGLSRLLPADAAPPGARRPLRWSAVLHSRRTGSAAGGDRRRALAPHERKPRRMSDERRRGGSGVGAVPLPAPGAGPCPTACWRTIAVGA